MATILLSKPKGLRNGLHSHKSHRSTHLGQPPQHLVLNRISSHKDQPNNKMLLKALYDFGKKEPALSAAK